MALATVIDPLNRPTVDLGPDEFVVRESGQTRDVLAVRIADYPVVVLIDDGDEGRRDFEAIRQAAARFITRLGRRPVAVGTLADPPGMLATFDDPRAAVLQRVDTAAPRASGTALLESVAAASGVIRALEAPFSAVVVLSATSADGTPRSRNDLLGRIVDSHTTVHVVARRDPAQPPSGEILRDVSEQTRGQFTVVYSTASYQIALDRLADQMAMEMMIEYLVPPGSAVTSDVTLGVSIPGARVVGRGVR